MVLWSLFYEAVANIAYALLVKKLKAALLSAVIIAGWSAQLGPLAYPRSTPPAY